MSTILFYESNRLSPWHRGAAQPLRILLGEGNEHSQAIAPAVSERDREWFGLAGAPRPTLLPHLHQSNQTAQSGKNIAASQNAIGAGHLCLLSGWDSAVWREPEEEREKQEKVKRRREKDEERDSRKGPNKASKRCSYVLFIYSYVLVNHCSRGSFSSFADRLQEKDMWLT